MSVHMQVLSSRLTEEIITVLYSLTIAIAVGAAVALRFWHSYQIPVLRLRVTILQS